MFCISRPLQIRVEGAAQGGTALFLMKVTRKVWIPDCISPALRSYKGWSNHSWVEERFQISWVGKESKPYYSPQVGPTDIGSCREDFLSLNDDKFSISTFLSELLWCHLNKEWRLPCDHWLSQSDGYYHNRYSR